MSGRVRVRAHAKLTLSLRVLGVLPDGYHGLDALAVSVSPPLDTIEVVATHAGEIALGLSGVTGTVPATADNLVVRAARALLRRAGSDLGLAISLHKGIPAGGGLGGGSADAAATLVAVSSLLSGAGRVDRAGLLAVAAELGSDVPFCVEGGAAWMRGRGEQLAPVGPLDAVTVLIVVPDFRIATPDVYRAWDQLGGPSSTRTIPAPPAVVHLLPELGNDLEPAAERVEPRLVGARAEVERVTGRPFLVAGSGSSLWTWFEDAGSAEAARTRVEQDLGFVAHVGVTVPKGVEIA
ncbi:MAG: 4-diphosphocytidyl-2-C-methyl-D-erythritol kinase [Actinomycetia bacterium]|nr:4-diphosphocytidyl-2-C-methyl-D-erythritol kinase [Actinomycetes bacterium]